MMEGWERFFAPGGVLERRFRGYTHRPQQVTLARTVDDFLTDSSLFVMAAEAPPGVGKTFAALIPALIRAPAEDKQILFLTATIALQEQLIEKDLPKLRSMIGADFTYGLLKGRGNYVCIRRAASMTNYLQGKDGAPIDLRRWVEETETGDLAELALPVGSAALFRVSADAKGCLGTGCPFRNRCFVVRLLREAQDWRVKVANYHLFFSHIMSAKGSFPVAYDWLVCDEAHRIPDAARSAAKIEAANADGAALLAPRAVAAFEPFLAREGIDVPALREHAEACQTTRNAVFELAALRYGRGEGISERDEEVLHKGKEMADKIDALSLVLRRFEDKYSSGGFDEASLGEAAAVATWLEQVKEYRSKVLWCLSVDKYPEWGYWMEEHALASAPVVCSEIVSGALEREAPKKVIFMSATLSVAGDFSFWTRETGVAPDKTLVVESPFDYKRQMELIIVNVGVPVVDASYAGRVCRVVERLCDANGGRSLVLLSSMRLVRAVAAKLRSRQRQYGTLVQGDMPPGELLRRFREDETSVLVGSVSFREGVDVPGEGLTQVIIDRIPFPHPHDPIVQARSALEGRRAFMDSTLPNAKIFLRQAVGRLIRGVNDHGKVVLLDGRAADRADWRILESLPECRRRVLRVRE
ncbi:MAG: ATP-dependent DNA helicase [Synergistaceae bacterium]|jgi:ATP-dependent DNA helicase DinG|nr:ATP-dependent DNA helicase [Synergistaceae bacterium]